MPTTTVAQRTSMRAWGLDPETKRRRMATAETYVNIANGYEQKLLNREFGPDHSFASVAELEYHIARVDRLIERAVQGI